MRLEHLKYLVCPSCAGDLRVEDAKPHDSDQVESGALTCGPCGESYRIVRHVPRFISADNYAASFGFLWTKFPDTQRDSYSGTRISETRFFEETQWPRQLEGQVVLEVGSGSGRFTEQAAATGAMVVSTDYSNAVDANHASNGGRENVLIVQADLYRMPFRRGFFDKIFCIGVLQHTPDVEKAFGVLPEHLKSGGSLVIDCYRKRGGLRGLPIRLLTTKYWVRPITRRMRGDRLCRLCDRYVRTMWPVADLINRIPVLGRQINHKVLCICDYRGMFDLSEEQLKEWAVLDTFDMLSPSYDQPQTLDSVTEWFHRAALANIDVHVGYNGIEGRGTKK